MLMQEFILLLVFLIILFIVIGNKREGFEEGQTSTDDGTDILKVKISDIDESIIRSIEKKYDSDLKYLTENDVDKIKEFICDTPEIGIGLPIKEEKYDMKRTIVFDS